MGSFFLETCSGIQFTKEPNINTLWGMTAAITGLHPDINPESMKHYAAAPLAIYGQNCVTLSMNMIRRSEALIDTESGQQFIDSGNHTMEYYVSIDGFGIQFGMLCFTGKEHHPTTWEIELRMVQDRADERVRSALVDAIKHKVQRYNMTLKRVLFVAKDALYREDS